MVSQDAVNVLVIWRGKQLNVEVNANSKLQEFGEKMQKLTNVKSDTLRLLLPQSKSKSARLVSPFSDEHSNLSLLEASILEGKPIRMMGALDDEIKEVSEASSKSDLRIPGFDEEEKRVRRRMFNRPQASLKLPQGAYIFCDFRTLHLPGIELNPPPSEALRRMHMLACDPGIIAIMNKHRWRVGIMTEMAPEGYVGISPKCILGFNKNHGEEISLRLRTDDLKGFRKYESIKKTLLHELAHMVYSEHDANFMALDKQLNEEAASLDWTKSRGRTLTGRKVSDFYDEELDRGANSAEISQKVGGASNPLASARVSSVAAAYNRILSLSSKDAEEPDPDDSESNEVQPNIVAEPDPDDAIMTETHAKPSIDSSVDAEEPDPDDSLDNNMMCDPDPDDSSDNWRVCEPDPDDSVRVEPLIADDSQVRNIVEPDPDDTISASDFTEKKFMEPDPDDSNKVVTSSNSLEADETRVVEPDPDDDLDELNSQLLQRIEEPVATFCSRIQSAIKQLKYEVTPAEADSALQTLYKIIRNVIEHPEEMKFKRLRKSNPQFQRNVANHKASMEILTTIGFGEEVVSDSGGRSEAYLVLKRNDPGLLWLAKSSLEVSMS